MNRRLVATLLLYSFGLDTAAFAGARPTPPPQRPGAPPSRAEASAARPAVPAAPKPEAEPAASAGEALALPAPPVPDPPPGSCDLDGQGGMVVANVEQSTSVNFNVDPPV